MKYDVEKITNLISEFKTSKTLLSELSEKDRDDFMSQPHLISSAKYNFIIAIEAIIDICNHLISKNGLRVPDNYADTFNVMAENGIFSRDFAKTLVKMANFRNRLVHLYWKVDSEKIYEILQNNLKDFDEFILELKKII